VALPARIACMVLLATATAAMAVAQGPNVPAVASYCALAAPGGAAPPQSLGAEQLTKLRTILAPYRAAALTPDDARAIQRALGQAGMRRGPALERALADAGFTAKRLEALAPCDLPAAQPPSEAASGRPVPRPQ